MTCWDEEEDIMSLYTPNTRIALNYCTKAKALKSCGMCWKCFRLIPYNLLYKPLQVVYHIKNMWHNLRNNKHLRLRYTRWQVAARHCGDSNFPLVTWWIFVASTFSEEASSYEAQCCSDLPPSVFLGFLFLNTHCFILSFFLHLGHFTLLLLICKELKPCSLNFFCRVLLACSKDF